MKYKIESLYSTRKEIEVGKYGDWRLVVMAEKKSNVWSKSVYILNEVGIHVMRFNSVFDFLMFCVSLAKVTQVMHEWDPSSDATEIEVW